MISSTARITFEMFSWDFGMLLKRLAVAACKNAKFPFLKTGPAREDLLGEILGVIPEPFPDPVWFAIPEDRFSEVEEFLEQYKPH